MKIKKVILGMAVFAFAIGTAFASMFNNPDTWIHVEEKIDGVCTEVCKNIGQECDGGSFPCRIDVTVDGVGTVTAKGFEENTCTDQHGHSVDVPIDKTSIVVCDVLQ